MDETLLRALLDRAAEPEPPMGALVSNSLRAGKKLRRRRNQATVIAAAAIGIIAVAVPAAYASHPAGEHRPQSSRHAAPVRWPVAFVAAGQHIVPVQTATGTAEASITIPDANAENMAVATDGKGLVDGYANAVVPVDLAARTAGRPIKLRGGAGSVEVEPDGRTGYVSTTGGVVPVDLADNRPAKLIATSGLDITNLAMTPNGSMLYVGGYLTKLVKDKPVDDGEIVPVRTATNTALRPIVISGENPAQVLVTPNGRTVVALDTSDGEVTKTVSQISVATGAVRPAVPIRARGSVSALVLSPNGTMAYVLSASAVTPVDLVTNTALPAIILPANDTSALNMVITPNGRRLYVYSAREIIPVSTVTDRALTPIGVPGLDYPTGLAMNPNGKALYVGAGHALVSISTTTGRVSRPIPLDGTAFEDRPWAFAFRS